MTRVRLLAIAVLSGLLAGCADQRAGTGTVNLPPRTQAAFERYLKLDNPGAFALADNGTYGWSYCPAEHCRPYDTRDLAINTCEKNSHGRPCEVYAVGTTIVWRGTINRLTDAEYPSPIANIGDGVVSLSDAQKKAYKRYLTWTESKEGNTAFAISPSKGGAGSFWAYGSDYSYRQALEGATEECNFNSSSNDCKIYAINGKIVWTNPVAADSSVVIGRGQLTVTEELILNYAKYQKSMPLNQHSAFATSPDSTSGGYRFNEDLETAKMGAIERCNASAASKGSPQNCALYDIDGKVVWEAVSPDTQRSVEKRLEKVRTLLDKGLITEDEAATKRKAILEAM